MYPQKTAKDIDSIYIELTHSETVCHVKKKVQGQKAWAAVGKETQSNAIHVCCSVVQCVAVWCSVLQCVAVCCSVL